MVIPHFCLSYDENLLRRIDFSGQSVDIPLEDLVKQEVKQDSGHCLALIDRDGVIVDKAPKHKYHLSNETIRLIEGVPEALQYLTERDILVVFVTNQPGVYKRLLSEQDLCAMDEYIQHLAGNLSDNSLTIDSVFFCPHPALLEGDAGAKECNCRKPKPGMLTAAMKLYGIPPERTVMFGDFTSDIAAARNAQVTPVYIATRHDEYEDVQQQMKLRFPDVLSQRQYDSILEGVKAVFQ